MAEFNLELGLTTLFFGTWELFGGYKLEAGERKDANDVEVDTYTDKHYFIIKQNKPENKSRNTLNLGEFTNKLVDEIRKLAPSKEGTDAEKAAETVGEKKELTKKTTTGLPPDFEDFLDCFEVYVEEVYLQIEAEHSMKKGSNGFEKDDKNSQTKFEYAFWVGIKMTSAAEEAIKEGKNEFEGINPVTGKTKTVTIPLIFTIITVKNLYIKVWKLSDTNKLVIDEMQLEDLKKKYLEQ